jgi:hypothetical protein
MIKPPLVFRPLSGDDSSGPIINHRLPMMKPPIGPLCDDSSNRSLVIRPLPGGTHRKLMIRIFRMTRHQGGVKLTTGHADPALVTSHRGGRGFIAFR